MKNIRKLLLPILAAIFALSLAACAQQEQIKFGTAGVGGNYYEFGQAFAEKVAPDAGVTIEVKETAGSAANIRLLSGGFIQLAIAQADMIENNVDGFSAIASLYTESCQIVAREDIETVPQLRGKRVSIGETESGTEANAHQILQAFGLSSGSVTEVNMSYAQASEAMKNGEIDAMFVTAGFPTAVIEDLAKSQKINLLPVTGEALANLTGSYDYYVEQVVPAGTYTGIDKPVPTVGVKSVLLASNKLSAQTVYKLTKGLFAHADEITKAVPVDFKLTENSAVADVAIPFHEGAKQYYAEAGVQVPEGM